MAQPLKFILAFLFAIFLVAINDVKAEITRTEALAALDLEGKPSQDDIKKAYRKRMMDVHPDKTGNVESDDEAQLVGEAYNFLRTDKTALSSSVLTQEMHDFVNSRHPHILSIFNPATPSLVTILMELEEKFLQSNNPELFLQTYKDSMRLSPLFGRDKLDVFVLDVIFTQSETERQKAEDNGLALLNFILSNSDIQEKHQFVDAIVVHEKLSYILFQKFPSLSRRLIEISTQNELPTLEGSKQYSNAMRYLNLLISRNLSRSYVVENWGEPELNDLIMLNPRVKDAFENMIFYGNQFFPEDENKNFTTLKEASVLIDILRKSKIDPFTRVGILQDFIWGRTDILNREPRLFEALTDFRLEEYSDAEIAYHNRYVWINHRNYADKKFFLDKEFYHNFFTLYSEAYQRRHALQVENTSCGSLLGDKSAS